MHGVEASAAAVLLLLTVTLSATGSADPAEAAGMKRTITMVAVEPKGGTKADKEPFPATALPEGKGYELKAPNGEGRWECQLIAGTPARSS